MPRGTPDGNATKYGFAVKEVDPAAIYQYIWGFSPTDGAGRLVYLDTFNCGLAGWGQAATGAGVVPEITTIDNGRIYSPPNAVKLNPGVVSGDLTWIYRTYFLGQSARIGFEAGFDFSDATPEWFFRIDYNNLNAVAYVPVLKFNHSTGWWQIQVLGGGWIDIFEMNISTVNIRLMQIKFVGDWITGKYVRALIGDNLIDLSAYQMPLSVNSIEGFVAYVARAVSFGAGTGYGILGYVLITKDEP